MSLHQDKDEQDFAAPIVSVSLGLPAIFLFGGLKRSDKPARFRLVHGDVVVWGGPSRLFFHGVAPLADGEHAALGPPAHQPDFSKSALTQLTAFHRSFVWSMLSPGGERNMTTHRGEGRQRRGRQPHRHLSRRAATDLHAGLDHLRHLSAEARSARSGSRLGMVILILMLDQAIFTITDTAMGIAADKIAPFVGRLGVFVGILTAISCAAFVALPFVAGTGSGRASLVHRADPDLGRDVVGVARAAADVARQASRAASRCRCWRRWRCWVTAWPARSRPISAWCCATMIRGCRS